ncbi:hypothetical protein FM104_12865 [Microbacterium esteraromaticum]|uniref:Uncharacterized protein n=3 Tax=Microbacterium TaxID=33882 RepID=A0A1R4KHC1_9MICO|nr:hypothetical protein FM104_12865 [Microbacterium esteraromaticum]
MFRPRMQRAEIEDVQMGATVLVQTDIDALVGAGCMGQRSEYKVHLGTAQSTDVVVEPYGIAAEKRTGDAHDPLFAPGPGSGMPPQGIHVDGAHPVFRDVEPRGAGVDCSLMPDEQLDRSLGGAGTVRPGA